MRRDSSDVRWQELKKTVYKRDNNSCRLIGILSARQFMELQKNAGHLLSILDPAHIFPCSIYPKIMYENSNVVVLNRYSHEMLDNCKSPISGILITKEERDNWWKSIIGIETYNSLLELSK